jgi:hypothetical protein
VIRSVLAAELFAMIHDFDVDSVLKSILIKIARQKDLYFVDFDY